jgi:glycosyltransferase involved in cell wall biosynthesis
LKINERKLLNILFVADVSISKIVGGAERVLFEQATRLAERGHNVFIITRKLPYHIEDQDVIDGVNEWRYVSNKKNPLPFLCSTLFRSKRIFEKLHQKIHFDCINFHQPFSAIGVIQSALSAEIPKVYTCHSLSFEEFISRNGNDVCLVSKITNFIKSHGHKNCEKRILEESNEIVVLSKFTKEKVINIHEIVEEKIKVIPGGVNLNKFSPVVDRNKIRKRLNIPSNKIIIFTVRNLVQRMGLENLIIAFNDLIKQNAEIKLVIGGEGKLKKGLIALARSFGIEDHIHFVGFIPEEELPSYYQMADLFVLPTKELEGFGLVTLEALASGLPVLGTPIGGTKEILGSFNDDFIFENTEPQSLSNKIIEKYKIIKENSQMWEEIRQRSRKFVERNYSWEKNIDVLEELFIKISQD